MMQQWTDFVKRQSDKGKDDDQDRGQATGFTAEEIAAAFAIPVQPSEDRPPSFPPHILQRLSGDAPQILEGFKPGPDVGLGSTPEILPQGGGLLGGFDPKSLLNLVPGGQTLLAGQAGFEALELSQKAAEMNVALTRSAIPQTVFGRKVPEVGRGTGARAAELRKEGMGTIEAAKAAAIEDPLGEADLNLLNLAPGGPVLAVVQDALIRFGIAPNELETIREATTIGIPQQLLAEMALDYLNLLVVLGPAVRASKLGLEFADAVARSGLRQAGESLPQLARRLSGQIETERFVIGGGGLDPGRIPGKDPSDIQKAIREARELQSGTPPPNLPVTQSTTMPPQKADEILAWFGNLIASPESIEAHNLTQQMRRAVRAERAFKFDAAFKKGLAEGLTPEDAYTRALSEMGGPLPGVDTGLSALVTGEVKTALRARVIAVLKDDTFELMSTMTALDNALAGKAIPRKLGTGTAAFPKGASAYLRLQRVFPQEILDALEGTVVDDLIAISLAKAPQSFTRTQFPPNRPFVQGTFGAAPQEAGELRLISPVREPKRPGEIPTSETVRPPTGGFAGTIGGEAQGFSPIAQVPPQQLNLESFLAAARSAETPAAKATLMEQFQAALTLDPRPVAAKALDAQQFELALRAGPELRVGPRVEIPTARPFAQGRFGEEAIDPAELQLRQQGTGAGGPVGPAPEGAYELRKQPVDPRSAQQKEFDYGMYKALIEGKVPAERVPSTKLAATIDGVAVKHVALMSPADRALIVHTLKQAGLNAMDIGNFLRANMASADLSWMRQQAMLIPANPTAFGTAVVKSLHTLWSKKYGDELMDAIYQSDLYKKVYAETGADFLRPMPDSVLGHLSESGEDFMALALVKGQTELRPFQRLAHYLPWIRISARAHVIGSNTMNWRIYEDFYKKMLRIRDEISAGRIPMPTGDKVHSIEKEMKLFAKMLADMSGRGELGPLKAISPGLNAGLFSLRLTLGRFLTPRHLWFWSESKYVRMAAWKNFASFVGGMTGVLVAGRHMGLWDLETNPESADFGKILLAGGRIRIDPWGGYQQWAVLYARILVNLPFPPQRKSSVTGQITDVHPADLAKDFAMSKVHPAVGNVLELWLGNDFKGDDIDRKDWQRWLRRNAPLALVDIYEAFDAEGLTGIVPGSLGMFGAGVQVYDLPRWPELDKYYSFTRKHPGATPKQVRFWKKKFREDPMNEAKLFVRGHIETLTSLAQDSQGRPIVGRLVLELMRKHKISPKNVPGFENTFKTTVMPPEKQPEEVAPGPVRRRQPGEESQVWPFGVAP
jgi:hypothetical protein